MWTNLRAIMPKEITLLIHIRLIGCSEFDTSAIMKDRERRS